MEQITNTLKRKAERELARGDLFQAQITQDLTAKAERAEKSHDKLKKKLKLTQQLAGVFAGEADEAEEELELIRVNAARQIRRQMDQIAELKAQLTTSNDALLRLVLLADHAGAPRMEIVHAVAGVLE